jgi:hypothetical protein
MMSWIFAGAGSGCLARSPLIDSSSKDNKNIKNCPFCRGTIASCGQAAHTTPHSPSSEFADKASMQSADYGASIVEALRSPLSVPVLLVLTLGAAIAIHFLCHQWASTPDLDERYTGEEYFQAVVADINQVCGAPSGTEQGCGWTQTGDELEICVPMPESARAKDCSCKVLERSVKLTIQGRVVLEVSREPPVVRMCARSSHCETRPDDAIAHVRVTAGQTLS